jgi:hypothetical protein
MIACPTCGHQPRRPATTRLRKTIDEIGDDWALVCIGASRYYIHKLRQRYPQLEFRAERITLYAGDEATYRIEARRP